MTYKGAYDVTASYNAGDVVVYAVDGVAYVAIEAAAAGITPHEERCWARVNQPMQEVVLMMHGALTAIQATIPTNIDDQGITLKTDDGEYLITVDDSGDTPELVVTEDTSEAEAEGT